MKTRRQALGQRRYALSRLATQVAEAQDEALTPKQKRQAEQERANVIELLEGYWPDDAARLNRLFANADTAKELFSTLNAAEEALGNALLNEEGWHPAIYRLIEAASNLERAALILAATNNEAVLGAVAAVRTAQQSNTMVSQGVQRDVMALRNNPALYVVSSQLQQLDAAISAYNAAPAARLLQHHLAA